MVNLTLGDLFSAECVNFQLELDFFPMVWIVFRSIIFITRDNISSAKSVLYTAISRENSARFRESSGALITCIIYSKVSGSCECIQHFYSSPPSAPRDVQYLNSYIFEFRVSWETPSLSLTEAHKAAEQRQRDKRIAAIRLGPTMIMVRVCK